MRPLCHLALIAKFVSGLFSVVVFVAVLGGCEQRRSINLAWPPEEPAAEMSKVLAEVLQTEFDVNTSQYADHQALYDALVAEQIDIAIIEQHDLPNANLNAIGYLYPSVLHVLTKACDTPDSIVGVVASGSIYPGPKGSAGHRLLTELARDQVIPPLDQLDVLDSPFGQDPDVLMVFGGILSADALSRLDGYCLASLGDVQRLGGGSWVEGLSYRFPRLRPFVIPAGLYPGFNDAPVLTLAIPSMLVTHKALPNASAYEVAELLEQYKNRFVDVYPLAADNTNNQRLSRHGNIPMHRGAQRFINRDGPTILERYAELLAFVLTLIVAITSAGVAAVRIRGQAKKDRLDQYYGKLLEVRALLNSGSAESVVMYDIVLIQNEVTSLVVDERVSADAALVAFYTLSNQILLEVRHFESTRSSLPFDQTEQP